MITPPAQVVLTFGVGATRTVSFAFVPGRLSVSVTLINAAAFVFCSVIVNVEIPAGATVSGEKTLLTDRSLNPNTVRSAVTLLEGALF